MALDREVIFAALFTRLQTAAAFKTASRKNLGWDEAVACDQPALFLVKGDEEPVQLPNLPTAWRLAADVVLFCRNDADPNAAPSTQLNELIAAVEAVLQMQDNETATDPPFVARLTDEYGTTLGGLCQHCWIAGKVSVWEGAEGGQAAAVIPLEILSTA